VPQEKPGEEPIDFEHARFDAGAQVDPECASCNQAIADSYYTINEKVFCERCKEKLTAPPEGSAFGRLLRAVAFGTVAAAVGAGIWFAVSSLTGYEFGLIAILVGFMVGTAVRIGSRDRGGLKYQFLAVFLTYAAIVSTYVPTIITQINDELAGEVAHVEEGLAFNEETVAGAESVTGVMAEDQASAGGDADMALGVEEVGFGGFILGLVALMALAFALPFLAGFQNLIGLLIIGFGLWQAWRINARQKLEISGPFQMSSKAAVSSKAA
jgi:hypothetical protein